jgi:hypothetical protein
MHARGRIQAKLRARCVEFLVLSIVLTAAISPYRLFGATWVFDAGE